MSSKAVPGRDAAVGVAFLRVVDEAAGLADPARERLGVGHRAAALAHRGRWFDTVSSAACGRAGRLRPMTFDRPAARRAAEHDRRGRAGPPGGVGDRAARRRRGARAAARPAHAEGALHGRRVGLPRRRGRRPRGRGRQLAPARGGARARGGGRRSRGIDARRARASSRAGSRRSRSRSASTPTSSSPPLPDGQEPKIDGEECVDLGWFTPRGALDAHVDDEPRARLPDDQAPRAVRAVRDRRRAARLRRRARRRAGRAARRDGGRGRARAAARRAGIRRRSSRVDAVRPLANLAAA